MHLLCYGSDKTIVSTFLKLLLYLEKSCNWVKRKRRAANDDLTEDGSGRRISPMVITSVLKHKDS